MRKVTSALIVLALLLYLQGCQYKQKPMEPQKIQESELVPENKPESRETVKVIKAVSSDLNGDGTEEKIEVLKLSEKIGGGAVELEGKLRITEKSTSKEIIFRKSGNQLTGIFQDLQIKDLDGDGVKDIMVVIPDAGGSGFTHNYFFIYDYKNDRYFNFNQDYIISSLDSIFKAFKFNYISKGKLKIYNEQLGFEAYLTVRPEENEDAYGRVHIDLAPSVIISEGQKKDNQEDKFISSIGIEDNQIRVPFLIYGQSVGDVVGEIDIFFSINKDFKLDIKGFKIYDLDDSFEKTMVGSSI